MPKEKRPNLECGEFLFRFGGAIGCSTLEEAKKHYIANLECIIKFDDTKYKFVYRFCPGDKSTDSTLQVYDFLKEKQQYPHFTEPVLIVHLSPNMEVLSYSMPNLDYWLIANSKHKENDRDERKEQLTKIFTFFYERAKPFIDKYMENDFKKDVETFVEPRLEEIMGERAHLLKKLEAEKIEPFRGSKHPLDKYFSFINA